MGQLPAPRVGGEGGGGAGGHGEARGMGGHGDIEGRGTGEVIGTK